METISVKVEEEIDEMEQEASLKSSNPIGVSNNYTQ